MKQIFNFLGRIAIVLVFLSGEAIADLGPKPNVEIDLLYNQQKIVDASFSASMLDCSEKISEQEQKYQSKKLIPQLRLSIHDAVAQCYWQPAPLAWGGDCSQSHCNFGYFPPTQFKLAIYIPSLDKTFVTNSIARENFSSRYQVDLLADGVAKITETTPLWASIQIPLFVKALVITIILELFVTWIFVAVRKISRKNIFLAVFVANLITLPAVWFLFPLIDLSEIVVIVSFELFAVIFEAYFIHYFCKRAISLKNSFWLSFLNNLVSVFIGGIAVFALTFFGY